MKTFPLIAAAIIMPSCAVILVVATLNLATARSSLDERKMTEAYSCAFLAGQYSSRL